MIGTLSTDTNAEPSSATNNLQTREFLDDLNFPITGRQFLLNVLLVQIQNLLLLRTVTVVMVMVKVIVMVMVMVKVIVMVMVKVIVMVMVMVKVMVMNQYREKN